jgi:phosphoribosylanthranilate isomerase
MGAEGGGKPVHGTPPVDVNTAVGATLGSDRHNESRHQASLPGLPARQVPSGREERKKGMKVIKAFQVSNSFDFKKVEAFEGCIDYALFDTKTPNYGGSGEKFDWTLLNSYKLNIPFFLSGGISLEDIDDIEQLDLPKLFGIDVNSRFEVSPGLKDIDKLLALKKRMGKMKKETI